MAVSDQRNNDWPKTKTINAKCYNEQKIESTMEGDLGLPILPDIAQQGYIFPNVNHSIVFIGSLYDSVCTVMFKIKDAMVFYKDKIIIRR